MVPTQCRSRAGGPACAPSGPGRRGPLPLAPRPPAAEAFAVGAARGRRDGARWEARYEASTMFVKSSLEVPFGVGAVREELLGSLESWLESLTAEARTQREHLLAQVGLTVASSPHPLQLDV